MLLNNSNRVKGIFSLSLGGLTPSCRKIKQAGELLDVKLLDHIILTPDNQYFSFADEGLL